MTDPTDLSERSDEGDQIHVASPLEASRKVLTVTAHFPPNFVSGGSLVPQSFARALAERGWESSVYAGWYEPGTDRASGQEWDDVDETGLPVRWINSTDWIGWADSRNFDNPMVDDQFGAFIAEHSPDLVHFHSLQGLGAGLLKVASDAGIPTVVTMHDYWWRCARQFLVDTHDQPCNVVVDLGMCECQTGCADAEARRRKLDQALTYADLILAPSTSAAAVLAANGIPTDKMVVAENSISNIERLQTIRRPSIADSRSKPVTIRYAGGPNPLKGSTVMIEAVNHMHAEAEWEVIAHGISEALGSKPVPRGMTVADPFEPEALADLLAETDIVVIPSTARESHSILTREALLAGVAVIASDCIGPEEVIEHGINGYITKTGDAAGLARSIDRLIDDPGLLASMSSAARSVSVVEPSTQIDELEAHYRRLLSGDLGSDHRANLEDGPTVSSVAFVVGIGGAPLRYRTQLPSEALESIGISSSVTHYRDPSVAAATSAADVVVFYRVPATAQVLELIAGLRESGVPVLFDVDDLIFDPDLSSRVSALKLLPQAEADLWIEGVKRYRTTLEACDAFVGSTETLADYVSDLVGVPTFVYPNGIGRVLSHASERALLQDRQPGPTRIGYFSGTSTHDADWALIEPAVIAALMQFEDLELWVGGTLQTTPALQPYEDRITRFPMVQWTELPQLLRQLDVNLAPLELGSTFNEAKSAIKWLEAALVDTVTIASATQPFVAAIDHGRTGMLATTVEEWSTALTDLISRPELRSQMGAAARRSASLDLSPAFQAERYRAILVEAVASHRRWAATRPDSSWTPVFHDEPPEINPIEPYPPLGADEEGPAAVGHPSPGQRSDRSRLQLLVDKVNLAVPRSGWGKPIRSIAEACVKVIRTVVAWVRGRGA